MTARLAKLLPLMLAAADACRQALAVDAQDVGAMMMLARIALTRHDYADARAMQDRVVRLGPAHEEAATLRALVADRRSD